jgi:DNA-binding MarR family transcriptional regulator
MPKEDQTLEKDPIKLDMATSYMVKGLLPDKAYAMLSERVSCGAKGLCVTRTNPTDIRQMLRTEVPVLWLATTKEGETTEALAELRTKIRDFVRKNKGSVILMDRVDYLINMYGFKEFLKLVYVINDEIVVNKALMLLAINPNILGQTELALLEQELREVPVSKKEGEHELSDDLGEILTYLKNNEKATFKIIGREFSITKTTTRKRINKLLEKNFVTIKKNGRNKVIRLTDLGKTQVMQ